MRSQLLDGMIFSRGLCTGTIHYVQPSETQEWPALLMVQMWTRVVVRAQEKSFPLIRENVQKPSYNVGHSF